MDKPSCFASKAQFDGYVASLDKAKKEPKQNVPADASFCWDCTARYQKEMIKERRCSYPEVQFIVFPPDISNSEVQGVRLSQLTSRPTGTPNTP